MTVVVSFAACIDPTARRCPHSPHSRHTPRPWSDRCAPSSWIDRNSPTLPADATSDGCDPVVRLVTRSFTEERHEAMDAGARAWHGTLWRSVGAADGHATTRRRAGNDGRRAREQRAHGWYRAD